MKAVHLYIPHSKAEDLAMLVEWINKLICKDLQQERRGGGDMKGSHEVKCEGPLKVTSRSPTPCPCSQSAPHRVQGDSWLCLQVLCSSGHLPSLALLLLWRHWGLSGILSHGNLSGQTGLDKYSPQNFENVISTTKANQALNMHNDQVHKWIFS